MSLLRELPIAIIDLVRYRSEGELPYRPYSDALHQHENRYINQFMILSVRGFRA